MNITIQVVIVAGTAVFTDPQKAAYVYRVGDIVDGYLTANVGEPNLDGRLGFIHITDAPNTINWAKVKRICTQEAQGPVPYTAILDQSKWDSIKATGEYAPFLALPTETQLPDNKVQLDGEKLGLYRKRRWRIPPMLLPLALRQELLANRQITVAWADAKARIRRKIILNRLNNTQDDESTELTDADVI